MHGWAKRVIWDNNDYVGGFCQNDYASVYLITGLTRQFNPFDAFSYLMMWNLFGNMAPPHASAV